MAGVEGQVEVIFRSKLPEKFAVPDDVIVVPKSLGRYGLSELINRLLEHESPTPFDFLINGKYLRVPLAEYMTEAKVTAEQVLELDYVLALPQLESNDVDTNEDWISGVVAVGDEVISCSFDGCIRMYKGSPIQRHSQVKVGDVALKCIDAVKTEGITYVAVGTIDGRIVTYQFDQDGKMDESVTEEYKSAIQCVKFNDDGSLLATAGADGQIIVWSVPEPKAGKKRTNSSLVVRFKLTEHSQSVNTLQWRGTVLLSAGADMQVCAWDILSGGKIVSMPINNAVTSLDLKDNRLLTSHPDGKIHCWKTTVESSSTLEIEHSFAAFDRLVCDVKWASTDNMLAAVSQDGFLKLLDTRSRTALQSFHVEKVKLLCMAWLNPTCLVTGASDGKLRQHVLSAPVEE